MIPWVILLRMDIFSALCDPWGSCDDKDQSVAGGEAAWGGSGGGGSLPQHEFKIESFPIYFVP